MIDYLKYVTFGFCWWDIPILILLIAVTAWLSVKKHNMKKEKEELQNKLSD